VLVFIIDCGRPTLLIPRCCARLLSVYRVCGIERLELLPRCPPQGRVAYSSHTEDSTRDPEPFLPSMGFEAFVVVGC
jgi:hypothetical protein